MGNSHLVYRIFCRLCQNIVVYAFAIVKKNLFDKIKSKKKEVRVMKNVKAMLLESIAKGAYQTAKMEADSACFCFCYQPVMPQKVKDLKKRK